MKATDFQVVKEARQLVIKRMEAFNKMAKTKADREVLVQEPVGYQYQDKDGSWHFFMNQKHYADTAKDGRWPIRAVYTAPQSKRLTDKQMFDAIRPLCQTDEVARMMLDVSITEYRAIEAAVLGEKP